MSNSDNTVTVTRDNGLVIYPTQNQDSTDGSSIRIPQVDTSLGADFGETITDDNRLFAATREPIAGFLIYGVATAIVEKWFVINDLATKTPDPELDTHIQKTLKVLKWKRVLNELVEYERLYGKALLVGSYNDVSNLQELQNEKAETASLKQLVAYPKTKYSIAILDEDPTSFRYGLPLVYQLNNGRATFRVHWTRCFELQTRTNGLGVLDLIWDDLSCGRNIRWGFGQYVFRVGGGLAVITFPKEYADAQGVMHKTTYEKLAAWASSSSWSNITHRTKIALIEGMKVEFIGAAGAAINPEPYFNTNTQQISKATGIPKSILEGAEAGALSGSEKNDQQYYKIISGEQSKLEDCNRWVIDQVLGQNSNYNSFVQVQADVKDVSVKSAGSVLRRMLHRVVPQIVKDEVQPIDYEVVWNSAFERDALDEARTDLTKEQAQQVRLQYMTVNEVRALSDNELEDLPLGDGDVVLSLKPVVSTNSFGNSNPTNGNDPNNSEGNVGTDHIHDSAMPNLRDLLKPVIKQVFNGHLSHELAEKQGLALIDFYNNTEKEKALDYTRAKMQNPTLNLTPEMEREFDEQKTRFVNDFLKILGEAEKIAKKGQT